MKVIKKDGGSWMRSSVIPRLSGCAGGLGQELVSRVPLISSTGPFKKCPEMVFGSEQLENVPYQAPPSR